MLFCKVALSDFQIKADMQEDFFLWPIYILLLHLDKIPNFIFYSFHVLRNRSRFQGLSLEGLFFFLLWGFGVGSVISLALMQPPFTFFTVYFSTQSATNPVV